MTYFLPEGKLLNTAENQIYINSPEKLREAMASRKIL